ncbi:MAG: hypothetical protein COS84_06820 [Armatimonadetes bacterium CG07_land_8_20_14_0_80_40_9]|nr:MAG: hypothetical protein COS84_06820 [Armatimonadetes bacterium CG07_land_8_20_14_0_80_40_9]
MKKYLLILIYGITLSFTFLISFLFAYDRQKAVEYANKWWNTDLNGDGCCDYVNGSLASPQGPYTWYYGINNDPNNIATNEGDNTIPDGYLLDWGYDCANFASQVLIAGGILMNGPGQGGTYPMAEDLRKYLRDVIGATETFPFPSNLEPGDIIFLLEGGEAVHTLIVLKNLGNDAYIAAHTYDRNSLDPLSRNYKRTLLNEYPSEPKAYLHIPSFLPPYVQDVKVYEGEKLRYHVHWEDVVEKGRVVKREKKFEERGDEGVIADAFGGEEKGFGLDRRWVKDDYLKEGREGVELEFEITFSQAVVEVKEVTFGLCPPYKPDERGKGGKKVECSSLEGKVWRGRVRILPEDIATEDREEPFKMGPLEKIIYRENKEGSIRGGNVLRIVGGKNSRGMEIDSDPTTVARIVTDGSGQKVWEGYEAITTILCPALTEEFFPCGEGIPDIKHTVLTNEHPELEGLPLEERYHQDRNHRIYLGDTYVMERVIR